MIVIEYNRDQLHNLSDQEIYNLTKNKLEKFLKYEEEDPEYTFDIDEQENNLYIKIFGIKAKEKVKKANGDELVIPFYYLRKIARQNITL